MISHAKHHSGKKPQRSYTQKIPNYTTVPPVGGDASNTETASNPRKHVKPIAQVDRGQ